MHSTCLAIMRDAQFARSGRVTLATIVLAAGTVGARHISKIDEKPSLAASFDADPDDWQDPMEIIDCPMGPPVTR
jgi:hypothetical protein